MIVQHLLSRKVSSTFMCSFLSKLCSLLLLVGLLGIEGVKGQKLAYYSITSVSSVTEDGNYRGPAGSSATYSQTYPSAVGQMNAENSTTLTLSGYAGYKITNIILYMKSNANSGSGTLSVVAGTTSISSVSPSAAFSSASWNRSYSPAYVVGIAKPTTAYDISSGQNVVITIAATANSLYIYNYQITYVPSAPTVVTTATPSVIAATTATLAGNITSSGSATVTASGIVYALSSINNTPQVGGTGVTNLATSSPVKTSGAYSLSASSLSLNTQYSFNSYAKNSFNTSYGIGSSFYTYAGTPLTPTVNGATTSTLDVAIGSGDGNPSTTSYAIQETGSSNYVQADGSLSATAVWQTASVWGTQTVTGLAANTAYTFQVKAQNDAGTPVETGFGLTTTLSTTAISTTGTLTALSTTYGTFSSTTTFTTTGGSLTNDIIITPPSGFEVSVTAVSGYATSLTLTQSGGAVSSTTIYVRLAATTSFGTYSGNIVLSSTGVPSATIATVSSTVAAKALTITGLSGADKVYNGTTTASVTGTASYNGLVNGETPTVAGTPTFTFNTSAVGSKTITVLGYTAPSGNYTVSQPTGLTANITAAPLTITGLTGVNKVYTGTTTATTSGTAAYNGLQNGEIFTVTGTPTASFANATVGTGKTITVSGYTAPSSNYSITQPSLSANITARALTITSLTGANKTYNGLTTATSTGTAAYSGLQNGETFAVMGTPVLNFATAAVGASKPITVTGYTAPSGNYTITQPNLSANITVRTLSITGLIGTNKTYNGLTNASFTGTAAYSGLQNGEIFTVTGTPTASFANATIGTSKTISVSGYTVPSANYTITQPNLSANITAAPLTITGLTGANKTYNGLTNASFTGTAAYSGLQNGEPFTVTGTPVASFANAAVGTGKTITIIGYTAPSSNYTITQPILSANIIGLVAAVATDYRSQSTGNLSTPATWQFDEGGGSWVTSTIVPVGKNVTILNSHTITQDADYNVANGTTFTINTGGSLVVSPTSTLTIAGAAAFAGNPVTLQSTSINNGGAIGTITGTLTGVSNVTVQRYTQAQRGYRTLSHPFTTAQPLSQLTNTIRVTGLTANNGLYGVATGNPSAFWYDATKPAGTGSVLQAVTDATSTANWSVGKGLYVFVRGNGLEGANGAGSSNYSGAIISPITLSAAGAINQGTVPVNLIYGDATTDNYNLIGNPYPSPINLKNVTGMGSFGTVYVYNPTKNMGTADAYTIRGGFDSYTNDGNNNIIIPTMGGFYVKATSNGQSLVFKETDKTTSFTPTYAVFGTTKYPLIKLTIGTAQGNLDEVKIGFNSGATAQATDKFDAPKLSNSLFDFYTLSAEKKALAIDYRSDAMIDSIIPLGIKTNIANRITISLAGFADMPTTQLVLRDKLLQKETLLLKEGDSYSFDISADTSTKGDNRFELGLRATTVLPTTITSFTAQQQPNSNILVNWATTNEVNVNYFNVQRSTNATSFTTIAKVAAKGDGSYNYTDDLATIGNIPATIYYRLQTVDKDGTTSFSKTVAITTKTQNASLIIYPNPVATTLFAQVTVTKAGPVDVLITDMQGKTLLKQTEQLNAGTTVVSVATASLAGGSYTLVIHGNGTTIKQQFIKE